MFSQYLLRRVKSSRHRKAVILLSLCVLLLMYSIASVNKKGHSLVRQTISPSCKHSDDDTWRISRLLVEVHDILDEYHLTHFLIYGSHLDALRYGKLVRWNTTAEFGVLGEEFDKMNFMEFTRRLRAKYINIANWRFRSGFLRLFQTSAQGIDTGISIDIYIFYNYSGLRKRTGHETWWLYFHYEIHHTFPDKLVKPPLPIMTLGGIDGMSVPKQGNEILRYLYKYDWWKNPRVVPCE